MNQPIAFDTILEAFEMAEFGGPDEVDTYLDRETGQTLLISDIGDGIDPVPHDLDSDRYIPLPDKRELGLGKPLVLAFTEAYLPEHLDDVRGIFARKGAYGRFKALLDKRDLLERWYEYESEARTSALRAWCADAGIALQDE